MSVLAMLHSTDLLGREIRLQLDQHSRWWQELRLLTTVEAEVGILTETRGGAGMVQRFEPSNLDGADVVLYGGPLAANRQALAALPTGATGVLLSFDANAGDGRPIVAGINLEQAERQQVLLSPHPAAVAVSHLLHPLRKLGLRSVSGTVVQPASLYNQAGLDELFEQARAILTFASERPTDVFGTQLAYNLLPTDEGPRIAELTRAILGGDAAELPLALHVLQGGIFHGVSASLYVELGSDSLPADQISVETVADLLDDQELIETLDDDEAPLTGPVDAAARDDVLLVQVRADSRRPGAFWIWGLMDNLTLGGAANVMQILQHTLWSGQTDA